MFNQLERKVYLKNGFIALETEAVENCEYAYYLKHPHGIERKYYTQNTNFCFSNIECKEGNYCATFFYRQNGKIEYIQKTFFINCNKEIIEPHVKTIIETEDYKIDFYDMRSTTTFVVFNGADSLKTSTPFGLKFLQNRGYNVVACLQNNNQYQGLSFEDFQKYVNPIVDGHDVFLYGSSLGGYCAVFYAGAINGTVIAAAPRNSAHPDMLNLTKSQKFNPDNYNHDLYLKNPITSKNVFIFYDPYVKADTFFINEIIKKQYKKPLLVKFDHAGHEVLYHINTIKQLKPIIDSVVNNEPMIIRDSDSPYTLYGKAEYNFHKKNYRVCISYLNQVIENVENSEKIRNKAINLLNKAANFIDDQTGCDVISAT